MKIGPLYVITDSSIQDRFGHLDLVRAVLAGGADTIQLRLKGDPRAPTSTRAMLDLARRCGALCRRARVPFLVNDRADVAWSADADGVHLGDDDLPLGPARAMLGPMKILGASADTIEDVLSRATEGADYCGIGPIFPTSTKKDTGPVLGLDGLARVVAASPIPLVAIGGISLDRISEVAATGVDAVAIVSAICGADDPEAATRRATELWQQGRGHSG